MSPLRANVFRRDSIAMVLSVASIGSLFILSKVTSVSFSRLNFLLLFDKQILHILLRCFVVCGFELFIVSKSGGTDQREKSIYSIYSGKKSSRGLLLIFSSSRSFLFRNRVIDEFLYSLNVTKSNIGDLHEPMIGEDSPEQIKTLPQSVLCGVFL